MTEVKLPNCPNFENPKFHPLYDGKKEPQLWITGCAWPSGVAVDRVSPWGEHLNSEDDKQIDKAADQFNNITLVLMDRDKQEILICGECNEWYTCSEDMELTHVDFGDGHWEVV